MNLARKKQFVCVAWTIWLCFCLAAAVYTVLFWVDDPYKRTVGSWIIACLVIGTTIRLLLAASK